MTIVVNDDGYILRVCDLMTFELPRPRQHTLIGDGEKLPIISIEVEV